MTRSGDIFVCVTTGKGERAGAIAIQCVVAKGAGKHPEMHRTSP